MLTPSAVNDFGATCHSSGADAFVGYDDDLNDGTRSFCTIRSAEAGAKSYLAALEGASDEDLMVTWTLLSPDRTVVLAMPRIAVLRGRVMNHMVHHRGQLSVYMRMLEIPVPAIYGPSADEGKS